MLNNEQIDLLYRTFTKQISDVDRKLSLETVKDGTAEGEFIYLLINRIVNPVDFQSEMFKVISENITKEALTSILKDYEFPDSPYSNSTEVSNFIIDVAIYIFKEYFNVDADERRRLSDSLGIYDYGKLCRFIQTYPDFKDMDRDTLRWRGFTFNFDCNNVDFEFFINNEGFIRSIQSIVKYMDLDRLMPVSEDRCLTARQVLKLGVTHKNLRDLNQDLFEGLSEKEFNSYINSNLDESCYFVITPNRVRLKEYLFDKLRGRLDCVSVEKDLGI